MFSSLKSAKPMEFPVFVIAVQAFSTGKCSKLKFVLLCQTLVHLQLNLFPGKLHCTKGLGLLQGL